MSTDTFNTHRIAMQVADLVRKTGAKFIVTTYEGDAWERLVYFYAREANPNIKCFGYQHAAVFKHQHAIKRPLNKKYNPDVILTSGLTGKDIFKQGQLQGTTVSCIGSPKHSYSSLVKDKNQCCLVIPEVFVRECLSLFDLSIDYAKKNLNQKFIWRLHPGMSFDKLKSQSSILKNFPNIFKKTKEFSTDFVNEMKNVEETFNFLYVGHWLQGDVGKDRKDTGMLVKVFLETFKNIVCPIV